MKTRTTQLLLVVCFALLSSSGYGQSYDKALMLEEHGLREDSKRELIDVLFAPKSTKTEQAKALYLLGSISVDEGRVEAGLSRWRELQTKYPETEEAKHVTERAEALSSLVGESAKSFVTNAVASTYLRHADFWSRGKSSIFSIDSSWIPKVETAITWYDLVLDEFPHSPAALVAFESKMKTLIGWKDPGEVGMRYGLFRVENDPHMALLIQCFEDYLAAFPKAGSRQAFRYQIAQTYWHRQDWENTRIWLNKIIESEPNGKSFYIDLARRRLEKVEY